MNKPVFVELSSDANVIYDYIRSRALTSKSERIMLTAILRHIERLKDNPACGDSIAKRLIPKEYVQKYEITNLYRLELPFFWRMLYTIKDEHIEIIAFVLDILNHKNYNKTFNYKK